MKNWLEGLNSSVDDTEEWISELDERLEEITQAEQIKDKRINKNEDILRDVWENINKELENMKKNQSGMKNAIMEMKNYLEGHIVE